MIPFKLKSFKQVLPAGILANALSSKDIFCNQEFLFRRLPSVHHQTKARLKKCLKMESDESVGLCGSRRSYLIIK
jgi:hypothetical protein